MINFQRRKISFRYKSTFNHVNVSAHTRTSLSETGIEKIKSELLSIATKRARPRFLSLPSSSQRDRGRYQVISFFAQRCVSSSCGCSRCFKSRGAFGRPIIRWPVEFCDSRNTIRQDDPRLLRGRVDVNVAKPGRHALHKCMPTLLPKADTCDEEPASAMGQ